MTEDALRQDYARYESAEQLDSHMSRLEHRGNMVMGDTRIEALDNSLFDKLQVFDGDISPMLEPNNNAIAIAVSLGGSLSKDLAASAFFGHVKGAFTGATEEKAGYFLEAQG